MVVKAKGVENKCLTVENFIYMLVGKLINTDF